MAKPADTRQMIERLKECPFCGGQPELRNDDDEVMREIVCSHCDFAITESANPEGAIARWNTRSTIETLTPSAAGAGVEGLREALRQWKCPSCGGRKVYQYKRFDEAGTFREDEVPCKVCEQSGLHPIASAALTASPPNQPHPDIEGRARELAEVARFLRLTADVWTKGGKIDLTLEPIVCNRHADTLERIALTLPCAEIRREDVSLDVSRLVMAAREVAFGPIADSARIHPELREQIEELDAASEAFASRVPWAGDPK